MKSPPRRKREESKDANVHVLQIRELEKINFELTTALLSAQNVKLLSKMLYAYRMVSSCAKNEISTILWKRVEDKPFP